MTPKQRWKFSRSYVRAMANGRLAKWFENHRMDIYMIDIRAHGNFAPPDSGLYIGRFLETRRIGNAAEIFHRRRGGETWESWTVLSRPVPNLRQWWEDTPKRTYNGPGRPFTHQPYMTRTATAVTIHESGGIDV